MPIPPTAATARLVIVFGTLLAAIIGPRTPAQAGSETLYTTHTADFSGSPPAAPSGYLYEGMIENLSVGAFEANSTGASIETPCLRMAADIQNPLGTFSGWSYLDMRLENTTHLQLIKVHVYNCEGDLIAALPAPTPAACAQPATTPHCPATNARTTCSTLDLTFLNTLVPPATPGADGIRIHLAFPQSQHDPAAPLRWHGHTLAATRNDWVSLAWTTPAAPRTISVPTERVHPFEFALSHSEEPLYAPFIDVDVALAERDRRYCNDCFRTYRDISYNTVQLRRLEGSETGGAVWRQSPATNPTSLGYSWDFATLLAAGRLGTGTLSAGFSLQIAAPGNSQASFIEGRGYALPIKLTHGRRACGNPDLRNTMIVEATSASTTRRAVGGGPDHTLRRGTTTVTATTHGDGRTENFRLLGQLTHINENISPVEDLHVAIKFDDPDGCVASAELLTPDIANVSNIGRAVDIATYEQGRDAPYLLGYIGRAQGSTGSFAFDIRVTPSGACNSSNGLRYAMETQTRGTTEADAYVHENRWTLTFSAERDGVCRAWGSGGRPERWHVVYGAKDPEYFFSNLGQTPPIPGFFGFPTWSDGGYISPGDWFGLNASFDNRTHASFDIVQNTWSYILFSFPHARFFGMPAFAPRPAGRRLFRTCDPGAPRPDSPLFVDLDASEFNDPLAAPPGWMPVLDDHGQGPLDAIDPFDINGNPCVVIAAYPDDLATDAMNESAYFQICDGDSTSTCPARGAYATLEPAATATFFGVNETTRSVCPIGTPNRSFRIAHGSTPSSHLGTAFEASQRVPTPTQPATWDFGPLNGSNASHPVKGSVQVLDFHEACPWLAPTGSVSISLRAPGIAAFQQCSDTMLNAAVRRLPDCAACSADPRPDNPDCQAHLVFDGPCAIPPQTTASSGNSVRAPLFVVSAPIGPAAFKGLPINLCASPRRASSAPTYTLVGADNDIITNHGSALGVSTQPAPACHAPVVDGIAAFETAAQAPTNAGRERAFLMQARGTVQVGALAIPNLYAGLELPEPRLCGELGAADGEFIVDMAYTRGGPDDWLVEASTSNDCSSNIKATWTEVGPLVAVSNDTDPEAIVAGFRHRTEIAPDTRCLRTRARQMPNTLLAGGRSLDIAVRASFLDGVASGRQICATAFSGAETTEGLGPTLLRSSRGMVTTLVRIPACGDGLLDAGETCDDGDGNGLGCGACAVDCSGTSNVEARFEGLLPGHRETEFADGTWVGRGDVPTSQGGAASGNLWEIKWFRSITEPAAAAPPSVAVRTTKPFTSGNAQNLIARVGLTEGGTIVNPDTLCGVRVSWQALFIDHAASVGAGLRTTLLQGNYKRWVDSPRNAADGTYVESFISPTEPQVSASWFFPKADLVAHNFAFNIPIHAGVLIARQTVTSNDTTFHFDNIIVDVLQDRDQDGICDQLDPQVCGNGIVEDGEACDPGCGGSNDTCGCNDDCTWRASSTACDDDGIFCNGNELCDGQGACLSTGDPCGEPGYCSEENGVCRDCIGDLDCEGTLQCETVSGRCVECFDDAECDDGARCTSDICNNEGVCTNTPTPRPGGDATCDNVDDDCDGTTDEDFASSETTCGVGICAVSGIIRCIDGDEIDTCIADLPGEVQERFEAGFGTWAGGSFKGDTLLTTRDPGGQIGYARQGGVDDSAWIWGTANPLTTYTETIRHYTTVDTNVRRRSLLGGRAEAAFRVVDGEVRAFSGTRSTARVRWALEILLPTAPPTLEVWVSRDELAWNPNDDTEWTVHGIDIVYENFVLWSPFATLGHVGTRERFENAAANVVGFGVWHTDAAMIANVHLHSSWENRRNYAMISTGSSPVRLGIDNIRYITPTPDDRNCNNIDEDCNGIADDGWVGPTTSCGQGACHREGAVVCVDGVTSDNCEPGAPSPESCNGLDDDCNGNIDDLSVATIDCFGDCGGTFETNCENGVGIGSCADVYAMRTGTTCGAGDACLGAGACASDGTCAGRIETVCKDENPCTSDICNPTSGCVHEPLSGAPCNDADLCTSGDICVDGACVADPVICITPPDRCPGVSTCDSATGTCMHDGLPRVRDGDCDGASAENDCDDDDDGLGTRLFDADCDGVSTLIDCDDSDPEAGSRADDGDCDGVPTQDDCDDANPRAASLVGDADCDGVATELDCDDGDPAVTSICTDCVDDDDDGHFAATPGCPIGDDCDDEDAESTHRPDDGDCDGVSTDLDCNDSDPSLGARALDADCDGSTVDIDCDDNDPTIAGPCASPCYDRDRDGFFDRSVACPDGLDCDDTNAASLTTRDDRDCDTIPDTTDNCREVPNRTQSDRDGDGVGDACDICPTVPDPEQLDTNRSGLGDACLDSDGDGVPNVQDNCPNVPNADQADDDNDGRGDACSVRVQRERREEGCHGGGAVPWWLLLAFGWPWMRRRLV